MLYITSHCYYLEEGKADVEILCKVSKPHNAYVGDEEGAQVSLFAAEIPHPIDPAKCLL